MGGVTKSGTAGTGGAANEKLGRKETKGQHPTDRARAEKREGESKKKKKGDHGLEKFRKKLQRGKRK